MSVRKRVVSKSSVRENRTQGSVGGAPGNRCSAKIGLQLYSIREELGTNGFEAGVRRIAAMGYAGVEPAGFPGTTAEKAGKLFAELALEVPSAHMSMPVGDAKQEVLDAMMAIGSKRIVSGLGPSDFETLDGIRASCDRFNEASAVAVGNGMTFGIHNHWWEFGELDGQRVYAIMQEYLVAEVFFEIDTYWVKTAGCDPAEIIRELGARAPLLHIKDGPCVRDKAMTAVGEGEMDFRSIVAAGAPTADWMIVELDSCDTDMMEAVDKSYAYLTGEAFTL